MVLTATRELWILWASCHTKKLLNHVIYYSNNFVAGCDSSKIKLSAIKTKVVQLARKPDLTNLQVFGEASKQAKKFKYFGIKFENDGRQEKRNFDLNR